MIKKFGTLMKTSEVAIELGINRKKVYVLAKQGFFIALKIGGLLRIYSNSVSYYKVCKEKGITPPQYFIPKFK